MKSIPKAVLTIRIDQSTLDSLKQIAKDKNRTVSSVANEILKKEKSCISPATESNNVYVYDSKESHNTSLIDTMIKQKELIEEQENVYEMPLYTDIQIRKLSVYSKLFIDNQTITVLDFIKKCKKRIGLNEFKALLKKSTLEELSKTLWK